MTNEFKGNNNYEVRLNVNQKVLTDPKFFTMPIKINIVTSSQEYNFTVFNNQQNQEFKFSVSGEPIEYRFDPDNWILKDITTIDSADDEIIISEYKLEQNYPNPFNPSTMISYSVPKTGPIKLKVYDILGNEIAVLVDEFKFPGQYSVEFNTSNLDKSLASGIYIYKLEVGSFSMSKKMNLVK